MVVEVGSGHPWPRFQDDRNLEFFGLVVDSLGADARMSDICVSLAEVFAVQGNAALNVLRVAPGFGPKDPIKARTHELYRDVE